MISLREWESNGEIPDGYKEVINRTGQPIAPPTDPDIETIVSSMRSNDPTVESTLPSEPTFDYLHKRMGVLIRNEIAELEKLRRGTRVILVSAKGQVFRGNFRGFFRYGDDSTYRIDYIDFTTGCHEIMNGTDVEKVYAFDSTNEPSQSNDIASLLKSCNPGTYLLIQVGGRNRFVELVNLQDGENGDFILEAYIPQARTRTTFTPSEIGQVEIL